MKRALWLALLAWPLPAHVMSMSSGDLAVDGTRAHFELRMPLYEVAHVANPERTLLEHIRFAGARLVRSECRADAARDTYLCVADYEFGAPVDRLDVECTFTAITVPTHVHLLRATLGEKRDEAIFDLGFTRATLRFRPPTAAEIAITQAGAGAVRALGGVVQVLFLAALVLAARSRRELLAIAAMFLVGQAASVFVMAHVLWPGIFIAGRHVVGDGVEQQPHTVVAQLGRHIVEILFRAKLGIHAQRIGDVVTVRAPAARLVARRRVEVGDAEIAEIRHQVAAVHKAKARIELQAVRGTRGP